MSLDLNEILNGISSNVNFIKAPSVIRQVYALVQIHERVLKLGRVTPALAEYAKSYGVKQVPQSLEEFYPAVIEAINSVATGPARDALLAQAAQAQREGASAETLASRVQSYVVSKCPPWIATQVDNFLNSLQPPPQEAPQESDNPEVSNEVLHSDQPCG